MKRGPAWDALAVRAARGQGAYDLALGEALLKLFQGDRLMRLRFARQADYARERLGVPAGTMFAWVRLARGLGGLPTLRRAVRAGAVSARKALTVLRAARAGSEAEWTFAAMHLPLAELEKRVRGAGHEPCADTFEVESIVVRMTPAEQDRLDAAIKRARELEGPGLPRWKCLEMICQEWLGAFVGADPMDGAGDGRAPAAPGASIPPVTLGPACAVGRDDLPSDPVVLDAYIRKLWRTRQRRDEVLGRRLIPIVRGKLYRELGFERFEDYCRDRLGITARKARMRMWLERKMRELPELRSALADGTVTLTKAMLIAKHATPRDVEARIKEAAETTWQQTDRDASAEEDRKNRRAGKRRLWGPRDAAETVVGAIAALQRIAGTRHGVVPGDGEALAIIADYFVAVWEANRPPGKVSRARRTVLMRHGGLCAVPGCSCAAEHEHHIVFRSRGGSNEVGNRVGLCAAHHLRGVHSGHISVEGDAATKLVWRVAATQEEWTMTASGEAWRTATVAAS